MDLHCMKLKEFVDGKAMKNDLIVLINFHSSHDSTNSLCRRIISMHDHSLLGSRLE